MCYMTVLRETEPKAKKDYPCIWCGEKILKGEWDVKEFAEKFERVKLKEALTDARKTEIERLVSEEKFAKALKKLEVFLEEDATQEEHFGTTKFWCLLQLEKYGAAIRYGNDLLKQYDDDMEVLLTVAGMIVAPEDVQIGANAESEDEMPGDGDSPDMPKDKEKEKEKEKDDLRVQNQRIPARNWVAKEDADEEEATPAGKDAKPEKGKIPSGLLKIAIRAAERALVLATEESDWPSRIQATTYLSKAHVAAGRVRPARKAIEAAIETLKEEVEERQAYLEALDDQLKALGEKKKKGR